ncbi:NB-ARC domain-containing protein [Streptomyces sp. 21So2-11]|uniref:NB-ARC domain-containing protein n=1 Tax=Streptomyces sp. 21So2-11 TaxID=3144408 RepID=UPI00321ADDE5
MVDETRNTVGGHARVGNLVQARSIGELHVHEAPVPDADPPPCQLPPKTLHFEDRQAEQATVFQSAGTGAVGQGPLLVAVSGIGGVGKTALAFQLARGLRERCPDGILFVDLDDYRRDGGVELTDVLAELLRPLGVSPPWLAPSLSGRRAQFWERTQGKRLVVVLDNVRYGTEAESLLPASADSIAIVISHGRLYDIEGDGLLELPLAPLDEQDAVRLLRRIVDDPRMAAEPEAADQLAVLCGGLPAALHVAAQWVRKHRRRRLPRLVEELAAELHGKGLFMVEGLWDAAYRDLGADAARLYRLLPVFPGPSITTEAVAALLGEVGDVGDAAEDALEELETASLLLPDTGDRFRMHDLVRAHARRCTDRVATGAEESAEARRRIVRWYLRQAQRADELAAGKRLILGAAVELLPYAPDIAFAGKPEALHWLEAERLTLHGCVRAAHAHELDAEAVALCEPLWTHFLDHRHLTDAIDSFGYAVASARRVGDIPALVRMRCQLARPLWEQGRYEEAQRELEHALHGAQTLGTTPQERKLQASAIEFRGKLLSVQGDWVAAEPYFERSRRIHIEIGNSYGVFLQTYLLGLSAAGMGEPERAARLLEEAHAMAREQQRERMTARSGFELGRVLHGLGRTGEARELHEAALASAQRRGATFDEARIHDALAALTEETGDAGAAESHRESARAIREQSA